ncbi:MAG TPA: PDZ domain-containing protein [Bacteroidales bacterium]|nr:PDZ domain-containing protein [Bacteroidales bacterium]
MKRIIAVALLVLYGFLTVPLSANRPLATGDTRLLRYPDIFKNKIVFCYGGDLYLSSVSGSKVMHLTSFPGEEQFPKFSPDGEQIAFTAEFEGNKDVYLISVHGGKTRRLTFHPADEYVVDWSPDGKKIIFTSNGHSFNYRFKRLHAVSISGGQPEVLELPEVETASFNDGGDKIAFCRTGTEELPWKSYRGGAVPEIWSYDFIQKTSKCLVTGNSIHQCPVWAGTDIYFVSDRDGSGIPNLWVFNDLTKDARQITFYREWGVRWPSRGGNEIVYENGGKLCSYNMKSGRVHTFHIHMDIPATIGKPAIRNVKERIQNPVLSPDGKKVLAGARGDLFYIDTEINVTRNLTQTPGINERLPVWNPDGKRFAFISDSTGEEQIYVGDLSSGNQPVCVSHCVPSRLGLLSWSPDGKKIGYADNRACYYILDVTTGQSTNVFFNEFLGSRKFVTASWSPDSRWIVYENGNPNWFSSIWLYALAEGKTYRVTNEMVHCSDPCFDPGGKYLYWIADSKINVEDSYWDNDHHMVNPSQLIVATLHQDQFSPFSPNRPKDQDAPMTSGLPLHIDTEGLGQRITAFPVGDSYFSSLMAVRGGVIYHSSPACGETMIRMFDIANQKEINLLSDAFYYSLSTGAPKLVYQAGSSVGILEYRPGQKAGDGALDLAGMNMTIDYPEEWSQIFHEAWRMQRDFLFDEKLNGVDWERVRKKYETFLPDVASRYDLNYLIEDMMSEMGRSHMEISGGDLAVLPEDHDGLLGADLEWDRAAGLYKIDRIFRGQNWDPEKCSPLTLPGMNIRAGDYLMEIEGVPLTGRVNPDSLLLGKAGDNVMIKVNHKPGYDGAVAYTIRPASFSRQYGDPLRYSDWVLGNMEKVDRESGGMAGYIHLPDTYIPGMESFFRYFHPQMDKKALIIDIRYNSGGYPPYWMVERLNRKLLLNSHVPYGKAAIPEPDYGFFGAKLCMFNEWTESGGEKFAATFRLLNSGMTVGKRTSGNLSSTGSFRLMDGGVLVYPAEGPQNQQGNTIIENSGISPDIEVTNRPEAMIEGRDTQLERSISEIMQQIRNMPGNSNR